METGIQKAVRLAGSQTALGEGVGLTPQAVQKWVDQGYVPVKRCRAVEDLLKGAVTRCELNPEIFGNSPKPKASRRANKTAPPSEEKAS